MPPMNLNTLAGLLNAEPRGDGTYEIAGVGDIERLSPEDDLRDHRVYFIECKERLKVRFQQLDIWMTTYLIEVL